MVGGVHKSLLFLSSKRALEAESFQERFFV